MPFKSRYIIKSYVHLIPWILGKFMSRAIRLVNQVKLTDIQQQ